MAVVYRATQTSSNRSVALKILSSSLNTDKLREARFHNEAALASRLNHPNTVKVYDFGTTDKKDLYIAMELIDGVTLGAELRRRRTIPWKQAAKIASQIGESLQDAHHNNIIHRDLKPDNVMLAYARGVPELVKVLDFGIAKVLSNDESIAQEGISSPNQVFGTPEYMSPEQIASKELDPRTDIYSLGILFYRMLTGTLPFKGTNAVLTMSQHLIKVPPPLEVVKPDIEVPRELVGLVFSMLEKRRVHRPRTMGAVVSRLRKLIEISSSAPLELLKPQKNTSPAISLDLLEEFSSPDWTDSDDCTTANETPVPEPKKR